MAQTYPCKDPKLKGKCNPKCQADGCGTLNQMWTLDDDGTLSIPISPSSVCKADKDGKDPKNCHVCTKVCLQAPPPSSNGKVVPESGCLNTEGGVLGMEFSLLVLGSVAIYLCCGVVYNLRLKGRPPAGTSFVSFLGPHREFCEACLPLAPPTHLC